MAYAEKKEGTTKWESFLQNMRNFKVFLYNKEKGEVMGRGAASWGKISLFFFIFYMCLAGFFAAMLSVFLTTLPDRAQGPKLTQYLDGKPVLLMYPTREIDSYDPSKAGSYEKYVTTINNFLAPYKAQLGSDKDNYLPSFCNSSEPRPEDAKKQCSFDLSTLGPCYKNESDFTYGFASGTPCLFMRMNRVFKFVPKPESGVDYVKVKCSAEDSSLDNQIKVYPSGWPVSFFPYRMEEYWLSPVVAIHVNTTAKVTIKCSANAVNIKQSETYLLERGAVGRIRITMGAR